MSEPARPKDSKRRTKRRPAPDPLAAYSSATFVCHSSHDERLAGDERLVVDLSARLASSLTIPTAVIPYYDIRNKTDAGTTLYIAVNTTLPNALHPVSICINNDLNYYEKNAHFYFEPFFAPFGYELSGDARVYPVKTLPSRVTPQNIADAVLRKPFDSDGKPVIALMLRGPDLDDLMQIKHIVKTLRQRHQARFLISTGPMTLLSSEEEIEKAFKGFSNTQVFLWEKSEGSENPYLWMLGAATHVVTTGTLSTTSDLLATGKPVYYTHMAPLCGEDQQLKDKLVADNAVGQFDSHMLSRKPPSEAIRLSYKESWDELSGKFREDLNLFLARREGLANRYSVRERESIIPQPLKDQKTAKEKKTPSIAAFKAWPQLTIG